MPEVATASVEQTNIGFGKWNQGGFLAVPRLKKWPVGHIRFDEFQVKRKKNVKELERNMNLGPDEMFRWKNDSSGRHVSSQGLNGP